MITELIIFLLLAIFVIAIFMGLYLSMRTENFEDKVKYQNSKIIYDKLKNNKVDFDEYKKKLRSYPDLMDVTIYDKVKRLDEFTVDNIYNKI